MFRHALGDIQRVKDTLEPREFPTDAAIREMAGESDLGALCIQQAFSLWRMHENHSMWGFYERDMQGSVPKPCDPYFQTALERA